jgi:hypothetical protein
MRNKHHFGRVMVVIAILFILLTAVVSARSLDGKWSAEISENFFLDWWMGLYIKDGDFISTYITLFVSVAPNKFKAGGEYTMDMTPTGKFSSAGWR